jgi:hypothetical protein
MGWLLLPLISLSFSTAASDQNSCSSWKNSVKLIIVPYINRPPIIDMAAAPPAICAECHSSVGSAVPVVSISFQCHGFPFPSIWDIEPPTLP